VENNNSSQIKDFPIVRHKKLHQIAGRTFVIIDDELVHALNLDDSTLVEQRLEGGVISLKIIRREKNC
jgi:hypothetical protein